MCGVSITISVWSLVDVLPDRTLLRNGTWMTPGNPVTPFFSVCCSRPASRFDSPSRSRSRVLTLRCTKDGTVTPPTLTSEPCWLLSSVMSIRMSPSSVTVGVMSMFTPTSLYWYELNGFTPAPPVAIGV